MGAKGERCGVAVPTRAARRAGMRAVALCTPHRAEELTGPHVIASVNNYLDLMNSGFLETLHVAIS